MRLFRLPVRRRSIRIATTWACAAGVLLVAAPAAFAGTVRYDITPAPAYSVDNTNGIVKITYPGCVTAGQQQTVSFTTTTNVGNDAAATYKVLGNTAELPAAQFSPATVNLVKGPDQTFQTTLTFTFATVTRTTQDFRFKLDPADGVGLGEGPGVLVRIPCVQPAALVAPGGAMPTTAATAGAVAKPVPVVPVPSAVAGLAAGPAGCLSVRKVTVRAGVAGKLVIVVKTSAGVVSHAYVRITGPGIDRHGFTDSAGQVAFRNVVAARSGSIIVQSNVCIGARRLAVLAAAQAPQTAVGGRGAGLTG